MVANSPGPAHFPGVIPPCLQSQNSVQFPSLHIQGRPPDGAGNCGTAPPPGSAAEPAAGNTRVPAELRYQHARPGRPQVWLLAAACGLGVLAGAAATVSYAAQYQLADAARHLALAAALEAAIPDAAALVFACLGVALALQGRRAIRAAC